MVQGKGKAKAGTLKARKKHNNNMGETAAAEETQLDDVAPNAEDQTVVSGNGGEVETFMSVTESVVQDKVGNVVIVSESEHVVMTSVNETENGGNATVVDDGKVDVILKEKEWEDADKENVTDIGKSEVGAAEDEINEWNEMEEDGNNIESDIQEENYSLLEAKEKEDLDEEEEDFGEEEEQDFGDEEEEGDFDEEEVEGDFDDDEEEEDFYDNEEEEDFDGEEENGEEDEDDDYDDMEEEEEEGEEDEFALEKTRGTVAGEDGGKEEKEDVCAEEKCNRTVAENCRDKDEDVMKDGKATNENANGEKAENGEGTSNRKVKKPSRRNRKRKLAETIPENKASKVTDKPESGLKKRAKKRAASMGMIFMCSSKTKKDCYRYKVLGLPASKRDSVAKIYKGMRLFLYDVDLKLMYGIYKAAGPGGYNIEPQAFKSQFPSQVRFAILDDCLPLPEEKFKKALKENYYTRSKFDCLLNAEQVKNLCKLFLGASKRPRSSKAGRSARAETLPSVDRKRTRAQRRGKERRSSFRDERRSREHHRRRERELIASSVASRLPPVPTVAIAPFPYERTLEMDAYRRDLLLDNHGPYRRSQLEAREVYDGRIILVDPRDVYRQEALLERRGIYLREPVLENRDPYRRGQVTEHRDLRPISLEGRRQDEIVRHDRYTPYQERSSYVDPVYSARRQPEYHAPSNVRTEYRPTGQLTQYRSALDHRSDGYSRRYRY